MTIRFRIPALAAGAAAGALLLTACSATDTPPAATRAGDPDPGTGHVHGLIALAADGKVLAGGDGTSWTEHGHLPQGAQPALLTAASPAHLPAADTNDSVYESQDGGRTWTVVHRPGHTSTGH
ncbi:hypothetical protein [Streptomyces sp. KS 21]|uniref:hypothetical protein n=1 Tax=Streptomyces sp. KS 21 TaxID=2485150 RepID=UPI0010635D0F|nr:hypothetical protein [Streptomyces sp. KS 21]TDU74667.1 hypothetical protein EDD91_1313 [Streptomyces sp. KS 21]